MTDKSFDTIIYHSPCSDGTAAAWIIWRTNQQAKLVPAKYGFELNPADYINKSVVIADFSFSRAQMLTIAEASKRTVLLDHHKSAQSDLAGLEHPKLEIVFDLNRSGAQIAWDYMEMGPYHWIIDMIADRDLWKWEFSWSKAVGRATLDIGYHDSVEKFEELYQSNKSFQEFVHFGQCILEREQKSIREYIDKAIMCEMTTSTGKYKVAVSSSPFFLRSDIGNGIMAKYPVDFAVMYTYNFPADEWWVSFRTTEKSGIDLSIVSKSLPNGGGHPQASGATIYGPNSSPPAKFADRKGENMFTYLKILSPCNK